MGCIYWPDTSCASLVAEEKMRLGLGAVKSLRWRCVIAVHHVGDVYFPGFLGICLKALLFLLLH